MTTVGMHDEAHALSVQLVKRLRARHRLDEDARLVIGIAGESGSGKSTIAIALAEALTLAGKRTLALHQDDYFLLPPRANHEHRCADLNHVGPHEVNLDLMHSHVADFRAGRDGVAVPRADYASDSFVSVRTDFAPAAVLIVEGTYVLRLAKVDVRIFLAATHVETRERRRRRSRDPDVPVIDHILAIEHEIIAAQSPLADIVIGSDYAIRGIIP